MTADIIQQILSLNQDPLAIRIMLALLIGILVYEALNRSILKNTKGASIVIGLAIAGITGFYITEDKIRNFALLPYTVVGIIFIFGAPLLLLLMVIHKISRNGAVRKIALGIYAVLTAVVYFTSQSYSALDKQVLLIMIGLSILFILIDKQLQMLLKKRNNIAKQ